MRFWTNLENLREASTFRQWKYRLHPMNLSLQVELRLRPGCAHSRGTRAGNLHSSVGLGSSLHHGSLAIRLGPEAELGCPGRSTTNTSKPVAHVLLLRQGKVLSSLTGVCKPHNGRTQGLAQGDFQTHPCFLPSISATLGKGEKLAIIAKHLFRQQHGAY